MKKKINWILGFLGFVIIPPFILVGMLLALPRAGILAGFETMQRLLDWSREEQK